MQHSIAIFQSKIGCSPINTDSNSYFINSSLFDRHLRELARHTRLGEWDAAGASQNPATAGLPAIPQAMKEEQAAKEADRHPPDANLDASARAFIQRWQGVTASELSTAQSFVRELCGLPGVDVPHATPDKAYMFERPVTFKHGDGSSSAGRIDCYRRAHFAARGARAMAGVARSSHRAKH